MAPSTHSCQKLVVVFAAVAVAALLAVGEASCVGFDLHHRSSPVVRRWAEARGHPALAAESPAKGSPEYYSELSRHDRALFARRGLASGAADELLTFADGNLTFQYIGSLYYALVKLGTPNSTFLVALDTGSDLFWVPCDCKQCAPIRNLTNAPELRRYDPRLSSTSKKVTCDNALCGLPNACSAATNGSCPYGVRYGSVSDNTSSSGVLVQDVLHLTREDGPVPGAATEAVKASIVFGCGQVQTGSFLQGGAFDGLLGLGMDKVSVPSMLATGGLVANDSFSMCFGREGIVGRINFGDAGSPGQGETPFIPARSTQTHPMYNVSFTAINVGSKSLAVEFAAVMDSGTSFTYLHDPEYSALATNFNSRIHERRANFSTGAAGPSPLEYCYKLSPNQTEVLIPVLSLTTAGGALFPVTYPIILVGDSPGDAVVGYCLAILKSDLTINIVGQNFMTGLKVVFNRDKSVLGWEKFDCDKNERMADAPDVSPSPSPSVAPSPRPTPLTPQQIDRNTPYPGAAPVPPRPLSAAPRHAAAGELRGISGLLLLALLLAAALV